MGKTPEFVLVSLGQKYQSEFPKVRKEILDLDPDIHAISLLEGKPINVEVDGSILEILPDEVEVRMQAKEGFVVASDGGYLAALVTDISPELRDEGLARELVRRIQDSRKHSGFDIADRINIFYTASKGLEKAIETHREYIMMESLSVKMERHQNPETLPNASEDFDGETLAIWLEKE